MRHLSLVEWRARSGVSHESPILRQSRQLKFNVYGEVQRPSLRCHRLPQVDKVGEDLMIRKTWAAILVGLRIPYRMKESIPRCGV